MRLSYKINEKTCNFHFTNNDIYHEINDLLSLLNVTPDKVNAFASQGVTFVYMPDAEPRETYKAVNYMRCIHENQLIIFLDAALQTEKNRLVPTIERLYGIILDKRFDSIVDMYTSQLSFRSDMDDKEIAATIVVMYRFTYESMEMYAKRGALGDSAKLAWVKTKKIFPPKYKTISEQRLFSLLTLTAPIWPHHAQPVFKRSPSVKTHERLCSVMKPFNTPGLSKELKVDALFSVISALKTELPKLSRATDQMPTP